MSEERACNNTECTKSDCSGCREKTQISKEQMNPFSDIKSVIAVMSGKGGVGKSTVTASMAVELARKGYQVGILDADVTGPSIPKMFGITGPADGDENGIFPTLTKSGIKVMSLNLLVENEEDPVIWRGPVIANMVRQFWTDIMWGELDVLLVDMPPGTGDVPITVFQSLPVDGAVLVTSPQDLVRMIVKKAYHMAQKMDVPILGLVENYSYFQCPDCGNRHAVFGESNIDEVAEQMNLPVLGKLPIDVSVAKAADEGNFDDVENEQLAQGVKVIEKLAVSLDGRQL